MVRLRDGNKGEQDYSAIVTAIKAASPDAVFWTAYYADGGLFIRQLRQAGYQGSIAVGDGSNSTKLFDIAGRAAEGVYRVLQSDRGVPAGRPSRSPTPTRRSSAPRPGPMRP